ncbi:MAG: hypothetical protein HY744_20415 [Deltaproteobacteria bacterium]|nr:hypothetical protein [Deltaproteobacteria bacterium]
MPAGPGTAAGAALGAVLAVLGPAGFTLTLLGALALLWRRLGDPELGPYTSGSHVFNLAWFAVAMAVALGAWAADGFSFAGTLGFVQSWLALRLAPVGTLLAIEMILAFALLAYLPLTHMAHFFMKYFLYHDIHWDDAPAVRSPALPARLATVLAFPVSWAAPHVLGGGKQGEGPPSWAEVAARNPALPPPGPKP